ncbi:hypothetical protein M3Y99_01902600 [Aphelenchoides fujianensis]|nr:hypothetical protein M3Y99_01902600 [Aphelenchoides fujianensis]
MADPEFDRQLTDGFPTEHQLFVYSIGQYVLLAASVISAALSVLVILRASPDTMQTYKWLLLNQVGWNFAYDLLLCLTHMAPTLPAACIFASSFFLRHRSSTWTRWFLTAAVSCAVGKTGALIFALFYRTMATLEETSLVSRVYRRSTPYVQVIAMVVVEASALRRALPCVPCSKTKARWCAWVATARTSTYEWLELLFL